MKKINHSRLHAIRWAVTASLFCMLLPLFGQEVQKVGTSAAAFLRIPAGARAIGMGSAFTAVADDGSAMFWNPGNIASQTKSTLFVHHSPWLTGLDHTYFGYSFPLSNLGVVGFNVISLRTEEMDVTTLDAPMGTGETYTAASLAAGITFARKLTDRFAIGVNLKYIEERIFNSKASGMAFDIGTMFVTPFKDVRFGVTVSNVGTRMRMDGEDMNSYVDIAPNQQGNNDEIVARLKTDSFDLPILLQLGLAYDWRPAKSTRMTFACDGVNPNDNGQSLNLGCELALLNETIFMEVGYAEIFLEDREKGLTTGTGIHLPSVGGTDFSFFYAYQDFHYLSPVNHFSVEIKF